jgi:transposase
MFAGLDVGFKRTAVCVVDEAGRIVWRGVVDTHPEALCRALQRWGGKLAKIGLESGSMTPWLARELAKAGFPVVCMDARAAADAVKSRRVKSDKADAWRSRRRGRWQTLDASREQQALETFIDQGVQSSFDL